MSAYGNDCHFYYNSTCTKGDNCAFRHSEPAKNCTVTCSFWQQGICSKQNCPYRHAELTVVSERNRQAIPCYWEKQPQGCARPNCQYQHLKPRSGSLPMQTQPVISDTQLPDTSLPPPMFGQPPVSQVAVIPGVPVIQPVVVHFSDSEVESEKNSPVKVKNVKAQAVSKKNLASFDPMSKVFKSEQASTSGLKTLSTNSQPQPTTLSSESFVPHNTQLQQISTSYQAAVPQTPKSISLVATASQITKSISVGPTTSQTENLISVVATIPATKPPLVIPELDYFIGRPFANKSRTSPHSPQLDSSPDRIYSRSPSPYDRSLSPWRRRSRSPSPRRSRSPKRRSPSYSRDRSRSPRRWSPRRRSPSPRRRMAPKNKIVRPQDRYSQNRKPVHERLNRERDFPSTSSGRGRQPVVVSPKKISLSKIKEKQVTESTDDDNIKVKSLEEIQRAKALLSMGLIELKSGKIVKISDVKEQKDKEKEKEVSTKKKKIIRKSPKTKKHEKNVKVKSKKVEKTNKPKKIEEVREEESCKDDVEDQDDTQEECDDLDDLGEEPEIDISEVPEDYEETESQDNEESEEEEDQSQEEVEENVDETSSESELEPVEQMQDIRRAVRKEDVENKLTPSLKRKRQVIVDDRQEEKNNSAKAKTSVHSRLGPILTISDRNMKKNREQVSKEVKVDSVQRLKVKPSIKTRIEIKHESSAEKVGSTNEGTIKTSSGGIKSRLGIGKKVEPLYSVKTDTAEMEPNKVVLKRTIEVDKKESEEKKEMVKRRRWNKGSVKSRLVDSSSGTSITDNDLKKIVIVRNINEDGENSSEKLNLKWDPIYLSESKDKNSPSTSEKNKNQVKSTLSRINKIIEDKKDSKEQVGEVTARKKYWSKLSVWSSRVSESIAATAPKKKESNIDLLDSSSNDSLHAESRVGTNEPKTKKGPKQERALYVPPGRKRTVTSYDDQEENSISPPPKSQKKHKEKEKKSEPESVKTYSQIMEEKRKKLEKQREKKAKSEEKSKRKITPIVFNDKENETVPNVIKDTDENSMPAAKEIPVSKPNLLDTFSFTLSDNTDSPVKSDKMDNPTEHLELASATEPDNVKQESSLTEESSEAKNANDDSWLDFSKDDLDMTEGDTADDDDLLREIDELLA